MKKETEVFEAMKTAVGVNTNANENAPLNDTA